MSCRIRTTVEKLIKENTLEELKEKQKAFRNVLAIMNMCTPENERGEQQKKDMAFMLRCYGMAIMFLEEES